MKLALLIVSVALTGCVSQRTYRLPPIAADEVSVTHTDPFGKIMASGRGIKVTEATITAEEARWNIAYPFWNDDVSAKNFKQKRDKEKVPAP